jgi:hypothetical protein
MKKHANIIVRTAQLVVAFGMGLTLMSCGESNNDSALAQATGRDFVAPTVFQAAGPDLASIQNTVDQYRAALALGGDNNGNTPGPLTNGRREINWDGGGSTANTVSGTPFNGFLINRETIFQPFSLQRLFSAIDSNVTETKFFVPGPGADTKPATTSGFGAIFTDVDLPDGSGPGHKNGNRKASTLIEYFGTDGGLLFSSFVPASPGDKSVSFLGIVFSDARITRVRITSGDAAPGPNDDGTHDIVMMDDFLYGEPQPLQPIP